MEKIVFGQVLEIGEQFFCLFRSKINPIILQSKVGSFIKDTKFYITDVLCLKDFFSDDLIQFGVVRPPADSPEINSVLRGPGDMLFDGFESEESYCPKAGNCWGSRRPLINPSRQFPGYQR